MPQVGNSTLSIMTLSITTLANTVTILDVTTFTAMEQCASENVNNCLKINIYSYLETSVGQSYNLYLNVVHFFYTRVN